MKIHLNDGHEKAKCGAVAHYKSFLGLALTNDQTWVTCRNCNGTRRVSEYARDTRGADIKKLLKKHYPNATFRVRIDKYSMGESINIRTDAINRQDIKSLLHKYESIDRDQWGEILGGGNTYLFVDPLA